MSTSDNRVKIRHSLRELDRAKADVAASSSSLRGTVSIGMLPSWSEAISVPLVRSLRRQYPELTVRLTAGFTSELQSMLERGELDVALLGEYKPSALLYMQVVIREALYVVGLPSSGLRADNPMTLSDAAKLPLILPAYPQGLRLMIDSACTIMGVHLNVIAESNSTSVQLNLVESEVGFTILPVAALTRYLDEGRLCAAPVTTPDLYRKLAIAQPVATRSSPSIQNVVEHMRLRLAEVVGTVNSPSIIWFENGVQDVNRSVRDLTSRQGRILDSAVEYVRTPKPGHPPAALRMPRRRQRQLIRVQATLRLLAVSFQPESGSYAVAGRAGLDAENDPKSAVPVCAVPPIRRSVAPRSPAITGPSGTKKRARASLVQIEWCRKGHYSDLLPFSYVDRA